MTYFIFFIIIFCTGAFTGWFSYLLFKAVEEHYAKKDLEREKRLVKILEENNLLIRRKKK